MGIKQIYICPDVNYGAAVHADKWIPILPNTDAALQLAMAYQWIVEDTYDKEYLKTHAVGFEKFKDYVLGKEDGIAKTPQWAAGKCRGSLADNQGSGAAICKDRNFYCARLGGPYIRGAYSTEPARLEIVLLAMQGLGKPGSQPGRNFIAGAVSAAEGVTGDVLPDIPHAAVQERSRMLATIYTGYNLFLPMPKQMIPKTHDARCDSGRQVYHHGSSQQMHDTDRPVHQVRISSARLLADSHDLERYAMPDDLLERFEP